MSTEPATVDSAGNTSGTTADDVYQRAAEAFHTWSNFHPRPELIGPLAEDNRFMAAVDEARRDLQQQLDEANAENAQLTEALITGLQALSDEDVQRVSDEARILTLAVRAKTVEADQLRSALAAAEAARDEAKAQLAAISGDGGETEIEYGWKDPGRDYICWCGVDGDVHPLNVKRTRRVVYGPVEPVADTDQH